MKHDYLYCTVSTSERAPYESLDTNTPHQVRLDRTPYMIGDIEIFAYTMAISDPDNADSAWIIQWEECPHRVILAEGMDFDHGNIDQMYSPNDLFRQRLEGTKCDKCARQVKKFLKKRNG